MTRTIQFTIPGDAVPFARAGGGKNVPRFTPAKQRSYMGVVKLFCQRAMQGAAVIEGPIELSISAFYLRPKSRRVGLWKSSRPDADNISKLVKDSLNTVAWRDDAQVSSLWFRCLVDWLHDDLLTVDDYKTTGMSVAAHVLGNRAADAGWHIQAAMFERGLDVLNPDNAGRRRYRFVAQEQDAPFGLNVMVMNEHWLTMGRKQLQHAVDIWQQCTISGQWPGYPPFAVTPDFPGFKETQWLNREIHEAASARVPREPMLKSLAGG